MDLKTNSVQYSPPGRTSFSGSVFELVFLLIVIFLGYWYMVLPKSDEYKKYTEQLTSLQTRKEGIDAQKRVFDTLIQDLSNETEKVTALDDMLPLEAKPSRLYLLVENLMQRAGLGAGTVGVEIDPQTPVAGDKRTIEQPFEAEREVKSITVNISGTGTIDQLDSFLKLLEASSRVLQVQGLDIDQGRGDQLIFRLIVKSYSYVPDTTPGAK